MVSDLCTLLFLLQNFNFKFLHRNFLQLLQLSINFTKLRVKFCYTAPLTIIL
nr:MAG TPA: hypothetical protein [Inoviridae sp.]